MSRFGEGGVFLPDALGDSRSGAGWGGAGSGEPARSCASGRGGGGLSATIGGVSVETACVSSEDASTCTTGGLISGAEVVLLVNLVDCSQGVEVVLACLMVC